MAIFISLETTSGATANGVDTNHATITLKNNDDLLDNREIIFSVSGTANFVDSQENKTTAITNVLGQATVYLIDSIAETVTVTAIYNEDHNIKDSGPSQFCEDGGAELSPPILDEAEGNSIYLSKVGEKVHVRIPAWKSMAINDLIVLFWEKLAPWKIHYTLTAADIGVDLILDVDTEEHLKPYVNNTLYICYSVNDNFSETVCYQVIDDELINVTIFGNRGNLGSIQSLLAFSQSTQSPTSVRWQYHGESKSYIGARFTDIHPLKELHVFSGSGSDEEEYIIVYPLNITSCGREEDEKKQSRAFITTANGKLFSWGDNIDWAIPTEVVSTLTSINGILASPYAAVVLTSDNRLYGWGLEGNGALVVPLNNIVSAAYTRTAFGALDIMGKIHAWGISPAGGSVPDDISQQTGFIYLIGARAAFCALNETGKIVSWGEPNYGGTMPQYIKDLNNVVHVSASDGAFAALTQDGDVYAWGNDDYGGQLTEPLTNIIGIAANAGAFTALGSDGRVHAWGHPFNGGVLPKSIQQLSNIVSVCASDAAFTLLCSDGKVFAWGSHLFGGEIPTEILALENVLILSSSNGGFSLKTKNNIVAMWDYDNHKIENSSTAQIKANYRITRLTPPDTFLSILENKNIQVIGDKSEVENISNLPVEVSGNINHSSHQSRWRNILR